MDLRDILMIQNKIIHKNYNNFVQPVQSSEQEQQKRKREERKEQEEREENENLNQEVKRQKIEELMRENEELKFKDAFSKLHTSYKTNKNGIKKRFEEKLKFLYWHKNNNREVPKELKMEINTILKEIKQLHKQPRVEHNNALYSIKRKIKSMLT